MKYDRLYIYIVSNNGNEIERIITRDFYRYNQNTEVYNPKIKVDKNQNLLLTGVFHGNIGFDYDDSLNIESSKVDALFLTKYNKDGKYIWSKILLTGVGFYEKFPSIIIDSNSYYLSVSPYTIKVDMNGDTIWLSPHYGSISRYKNILFVLEGLNGTDSYSIQTMYDTLRLTKLDTSGITIWSKNLICGKDPANPPYTPRINAKIFSTETRVYIFGMYWWDFDFDPSSSNDYVLSNKNMTSTNHGPFPIFHNFLAVYDSSGKFINAKERLEANSFFFPKINGKEKILGIANGKYILYDDNLDTIWSQSLGKAPIPSSYYFIDYNQSLFISGLFRYRAEFELFNKSLILYADYEDIYVVNYSIDIQSNNNISDKSGINPIIFPNPVEDFLSISNINGNADIILMDMSGKTILYKKIQDEGILDCKELKYGIYILKIRNDSSQYLFKVVKI